MAAALRPVPAVQRRQPSLILPGEAVLCPLLHVVPDTVYAGAALRQCRDRVKHERYGRPCNAWVWVVQLGQRWRAVVHVSDEEARYILQRELDDAAIRDFLRLRWH